MTPYWSGLHYLIHVWLPHNIIGVYLNEFRRAETTDPHEATFSWGLQHVKYDVEYVSYDNSSLEMYYLS